MKHFASGQPEHPLEDFVGTLLHTLPAPQFFLEHGSFKIHFKDGQHFASEQSKHPLERNFGTLVHTLPSSQTLEEQGSAQGLNGHLLGWQTLVKQPGHPFAKAGNCFWTHSSSSLQLQLPETQAIFGQIFVAHFAIGQSGQPLEDTVVTSLHTLPLSQTLVEHASPQVFAGHSSHDFNGQPGQPFAKSGPRFSTQTDPILQVQISSTQVKAGHIGSDVPALNICAANKSVIRIICCSYSLLNFWPLLNLLAFIYINKQTLLL